MMGTKSKTIGERLDELECVMLMLKADIDSLAEREERNCDCGSRGTTEEGQQRGGEDQPVGGREGEEKGCCGRVCLQPCNRKIRHE